jgi:acetolactate synthase-1/2/3 large subunit
MSKISRFVISDKDLRILKKKKLNHYKNIDYSKLVVRKPWGYEYLTYQSKKVAVWILCLKKGQQTSMHAHPKKKTSLIVLDGEVTCSSIKKKIKKKTGDAVIIDRKVFHKTLNQSNNDSIIMEIETPNDKGDLIRFSDKYGRAGKGYEKADKFDVNLSNYNFITLKSQDVLYNFTKKYGNTSIIFKKISNDKDFKILIQNNSKSLITILDGRIEIENLEYSICDTFLLNNNKKIKLNSKSCLVLLTSQNSKTNRVSDIVLETLANQEIKNLFFVPSDANLHLLDAVGRNENIKYYTFENDNAAAIAAVAFSKYTNNPSCLIISSGISSARAIEAVASSYIDSDPLIIISGQSDSVYKNSKLRQEGSKSLRTSDLIKSVTKYTATIRDEKESAYEIEKAIFISKAARPGPVWINIPVKILGKIINGNLLKHFKNLDKNFEKKQKQIRSNVLKVFNLINKSKKPLLIAGYGIKLSNSKNEFLNLLKKLKIPCVTSRRGADLVGKNNKFYFGRPGVYGQRYSNFIVQSSDLIISLGSRLSIPFTGRDTENFAKNAKKIILDIDTEELKKNKFKNQILIKESVNEFINLMSLCLPRLKKFKIWLKKCNELKKKYNFNFEKYNSNKFVNPYIFTKKISALIPDSSLIVMDGGSIMNFIMQAFDFKKDQRLISASGLDNEGFSFLASVGLSCAVPEKEIFCFSDEKSILNSISELNSLRKYNKKINIICFSGIDYLAIRGTQKDFFGERYVGTDFKYTKKYYNLKKIINNFGIHFSEIKKIENLTKVFKNFKNYKKINFLNVCIDNKQNISPKMGFSLDGNGKWMSKPLEDMYPHLERNEVLKAIK